MMDSYNSSIPSVDTSCGKMSVKECDGEELSQSSGDPFLRKLMRKLWGEQSSGENESALARGQKDIGHVNKPEPVIHSHPQPETCTYFGVYIPPECERPAEEIDLVYADKAECLALMKRFKGSRFKSFCSYDEALAFSHNGPNCIASPPLPLKEDTIDSMGLGSEKSSPFRGPRSQDLIKFRKAIEKGSIEFFSECVNSNPRYLVSSGDTPTILHEGSRYNGLHVACRNNQPVMCSLILSAITAEFFQKLYPDDPVESSDQRSHYLMDLFLNMPDKGLNETPLHFASKYGSVDCVRVLVSYPLCKKDLLNKSRQTPYEVICSRASTKGKFHEDIVQLLGDQYYVPLFRAEDNCTTPVVGKPWSPTLSSSPLSSPALSLLNSSGSGNNIVSPLKIRGLAGPMSPQKAEDFHRKWRHSAVPSPSRSRTGWLAAIRIADHEKGFERVGRNLACDFAVGWTEYWDFLGQFANFSTPEGLGLLEEHLKKKLRQCIELRDQELSVTLTESPNHLSPLREETWSEVEGNTPNQHQVKDSFQSGASSIGDLCRELEALRLNASMSPEADYSPPRKRKYTMPRPVDPDADEMYSQHVDAAADPVSTAVNYCLQSTSMAARRIANILSDLSCDVQSLCLPDLSLCKTVKQKIKSESVSLQKVMQKSVSHELELKLDLGFIHLYLSAVCICYLTERLPPSDIYLLSETFKILVSSTEFLDGDSSEEELDNVVHPIATSQVDKRNGEQAHFRCILACLGKALALSSSLSEQGCSPVHIKDLGQCNCLWSASNDKDNNRLFVNTVRNCDGPLIINKLLTSSPKRDIMSEHATSPNYESRFTRARLFLYNLFNSDEREDKTDAHMASCTKTARHLDFSDSAAVLADDSTRTNGHIERSPVFRVFENDDVIVNGDCQSGEVNSMQTEDPESAETGSFVSAASSLSDDGMLTPDEQFAVYINGPEPSKTDADVLIALDGLDIDENHFPNVARWIQLVKSHSEQTRDMWASPCCRKRRLSCLVDSPFSGSTTSTSSFLQKSGLFESTKLEFGDQ